MFILFPDRLELMKAKHKAAKHHLKYYDREKNAAYMRSHRRHCAAVFKAKKAAPRWSKSELDIAYSDLRPHFRIKDIDKIKRSRPAVYHQRSRHRKAGQPVNNL
jgi:hypothetical protein